MSTSIIIKNIISNALYTSGLACWKINKYSKNKYLVLMYHRVLLQDKETEGVQKGMYVDINTFKDHLGFLKKYFRIISLEEIKNHLTNTNEKPICILTFDDGWRDFYSNAFPVLKCLDIPATVFLPTEFIGTNKLFWTDRLSRLVRNIENKPMVGRKNNYSKSPIINILEKSHGTIHDKFERAINYLKPLGENKIEEILSELTLRWNIDGKSPEPAFISWDEAREMFETGLITYGSHTANHRILTQLGDEDIYNELNTSKIRLYEEGLCKSKYLSFCYPNGYYNCKINDMVKNAGYDIAVSTKFGWNFHVENVFLLSRIGMHQDMTGTEAMLACRIATFI